MALSRVKVWGTETLYASDLNAEFDNIINNASSLISPLGGALDWDGYAHTLDAAGVTTAQSTAAIGWSFTPGSKSGTPGTTGGITNYAASTWTDSNTAGSGTATNWVGHAFQRPTLAASNASVTTTNAATVYIANAPLAGTNETLTNSYALWVDDGKVRFDGDFNIIPAGIILQYGGSSTPSGWLECDGSAVSRSTYATLFAAISTTYGTGDGATTFNLPDFKNASPIGKGARTVTASGSDSDVDTTGDTLTVASNNTKWVTGMSVVFTLSSGTITGLTSGNTYYVIRSSSTLVQLASSLANAQNGTAINMTAKSSPVWTITHTDTTRTLGETGGEESHAMSSTELLAHTHAISTPSTFAGGGANNAPGGSAGTSGSTGGNAAMNIMNPFVAVMFIIKT